MGQLKFNKGEDIGLSLVSEGIIKPEDTEISFYVGDSPGTKTCKAACEHCFIPFSPESGKLAPDRENLSLDQVIEIEKRQISDLKSFGYRVVPIIPDTFAHNGAYLSSGILKRNTLYNQDGFENRGVAWTSGLPLLKGDSKELLDLALENELSLIAITNNGTFDHEIGLKGIVPPSLVKKVVEMIQLYNKCNNNRFEISLTFTVGTYNLSYESIMRYISHAESLGVDYVRFNRFIDFTKEHRFHDRMFSTEHSKSFLEIMNRINIEGVGNIDVLISTDFGNESEEVLGLDTKINRCGGGSHGFGVLKGLIYPCVEMLQYQIGELVLTSIESLDPIIASRFPNNQREAYNLNFYDQKIRRLATIKSDNRHKGCVGHTIQYFNLDL